MRIACVAVVGDPVPWRFDLPGGWLTLESTAPALDGRHEVSVVRIRRR